MARGKKQHAKGTKGKSAGYSKDDLSVTSLHNREEPFSSTQFCQRVTPNRGAGEDKFIPTFSSRKRNVQFASNLELSIPKSKVVPRFGKKKEKECSSDNGIEDSNDPPCSTKDLPLESDEESSNKSFPPTLPTLEQGLKDEPQELQPCGTCTATQVQNNPGNSLQDTPLADKVAPEETSTEDTSLPVHLSEDPLLPTEESKEEDEPHHPIADPSQLSFEKCPNTSTLDSTPPNTDYLNKLSDFCDLISDESDTEEGIHYNRLSSFSSQLVHPNQTNQTTATPSGVPSSQPLPQNRLLRAPGLVLAQAVTSPNCQFSEEPPHESTTGSMECQSLEALVTTHSPPNHNNSVVGTSELKEANVDEVDHGDSRVSDLTEEGVASPTNPPEVCLSLSDSSQETNHSLAHVDKEIQPPNNSIDDDLPPLDNTTEDGDGSRVLDPAFEVSQDDYLEVPHASNPDSPSLSTSKHSSPMQSEQTFHSANLLVPGSHLSDTYAGCDGSSHGHNQSFSLYTEMDKASHKTSTVHTVNGLLDAVSKSGNIDSFSESAEDTCITLVDAGSDHPTPSLGTQTAVAIREDISSVPSCGTPCTQCSSSNIPSFDMKCSKQPDLDDSGVKLLEGILSELSSLNRFVMTCRRELELARRHRTAWLRANKQRR